jgi:translation elongation factor EF-1alpha
LNSVYDDVSRVVGETFDEDSIVAALRTCNYNAELAIGHLLDPPVLNKKPEKPKTVAPSAPIPVKAPTRNAVPEPKPVAGVWKGPSISKLSVTTSTSQNSAKIQPRHPQHQQSYAEKASHLKSIPSAISTSTSHSSTTTISLPVTPSFESFPVGNDLVNASGTPIYLSSISSGTSSLSSSLSSTPQPPIPLEVRDWVENMKPRLSVVVVGHVDAGKSTLMGHLLADLGIISSRTIAKFAKEAKECGKASFAYAWVLDESASERARGVTVDVGMNYFETKSARFTLLDAPGHRDFVPNMIAGAAQADVAVLVVDATPGGFESGFGSGGQTREHAALVRNFGVTQLVVAVNKLDQVGWAQTRFEAIKSELLSYLLSVGFGKDKITFVPVSGLSGINLVKSPAQLLAELDSKEGGGGGGEEEEEEGDSGFVHSGLTDDLADLAADLGLGITSSSSVLNRRGNSKNSSSGGGGGGGGGKRSELKALLGWYTGGLTLIQALDRLRPPPRSLDKPLRVCVYDVFRPAGATGGVAIAGRIEGGFVTPHTRLVIVPGGEIATVKSVSVNSASMPFAAAGDIVEITLGGLDADAVFNGSSGQGILSPGRVLCWPSHPSTTAIKFKAQIATLPSLDMPIVAGQQFMLHSHALEVTCNVTRLLRTLDREGQTKEVKPRLVNKGEVCVIRLRLLSPAALELFQSNRRLGRFILRYCGVTFAVGQVLKIKR